MNYLDLFGTVSLQILSEDYLVKEIKTVESGRARALSGETKIENAQPVGPCLIQQDYSKMSSTQQEQKGGEGDNERHLAATAALCGVDRILYAHGQLNTSDDVKEDAFLMFKKNVVRSGLFTP